MKKAGNIDEKKLRLILDDPVELQVNFEADEWTMLLERVQEFMRW